MATPNFASCISLYDDLVKLTRQNAADTKIVFATVPPFGCCRTIPYWTEQWVTDRNEVRRPTTNEAVAVVSDRYDFVDLVDLNRAIDVETDLVPGDWNGDAEFDTRDFVTAFQFGTYEANFPGLPTFQNARATWEYWRFH